MPRASTSLRTNAKNTQYLFSQMSTSSIVKSWLTLASFAIVTSKNWFTYKVRVSFTTLRTLFALHASHRRRQRHSGHSNCRQKWISNDFQDHIPSCRWCRPHYGWYDPPDPCMHNCRYYFCLIFQSTGHCDRNCTQLPRQQAGYHYCLIQILHYSPVSDCLLPAAATHVLSFPLGSACCYFPVKRVT